MCGRWYLPMFLFRDGSLTLIEQSLFDCPGKVLVLPSNYGEIFDGNFTSVHKGHDPSLNRNIGKYHLPHIGDEVLHKTSEFKLKY